MLPRATKAGSRAPQALSNTSFNIHLPHPTPNSWSPVTDTECEFIIFTLQGFTGARLGRGGLPGFRRQPSTSKHKGKNGRGVDLVLNLG